MTETTELARIAAALEELLAWTRLQGVQKAKDVLTATLAEDDQRRIYQASTGNSSSQIAKEVKCGESTVQRLWQRCYKLGLMKPDPKTPGRYLRSFDLKDFDLLPSKLSEENTEAAATPAKV